MTWDKLRLKKVVEPVLGKDLSQTDPQKNSVHEYKKYVTQSSLSNNQKIEFNRLYLQVFWERYSNPKEALNAPLDVLYEALYAMYTGSTQKTAENNSALLHLLKQQANQGTGHWAVYSYLSDLIVSDKNLNPEPDDQKFSLKIRVIFDYRYAKNKQEIKLKVNQEENVRLAAIKQVKRAAKELKKQEQEKEIANQQAMQQKLLAEKPENITQVVAQKKTALQPASNEPLKIIEYASINLFYLACLGGIIEFTLENTTSLPYQRSLMLAGTTVCAIPGTLFAYACYKERNIWNNFQAVKKDFESDPNWTVVQFVNLIKAYRKVKDHNPGILTGDSKKIIFIKEILHIYKVLNQYVDYDFLQFNGEEILKAMDHMNKDSDDDVQGLRKTANEPGILLSKIFPNPTHEIDIRFVRFNNFLVNGQGLLTDNERECAEKLINELKTISKKGQISYFYIKTWQLALNHQNYSNLSKTTFNKK